MMQGPCQNDGPCNSWRSGVAPQHLPFIAELWAPGAAENTALTVALAKPGRLRRPGIRISYPHNST